MDGKLPEINDTNEIVIEFDDVGPDKFGRRRFMCYWLDDNVGPTCDKTGVRGQFFRTDPIKFVDEARQTGKAVRLLNA